MKIGISGASGLVGRTLLKVLAENSLNIKELRLFSSYRSLGQKLTYKGSTYETELLSYEAVSEKYDFFFIAAGKEVALDYAPAAERAGNIVIDNSSAFRRTHPLIIPEVNGHEIDDYKGIISNPNCTTIQLLLALVPLHREYSLKSLIISTYQAVSGAGNKGIETICRERGNQSGKRDFPSIFHKPIDMNIIPQIGKIDSEGHCEEELKVHYEVKRILGLDHLQIAVTTARVPVLNSHCESVCAEFAKDIDLEKIPYLMEKSTRIEYLGKEYICPNEIEKADQTYVCRVRKGLDGKTLLFWNVADNIRVGAATNAVNIMKYLLGKKKRK